jgi:hypothetical protein
MCRALALLGLLVALAAPVRAEDSDGIQIYGLSLGQRAPDPSDMGGLQAAFGPAVAKSLKGLMLVESGAPHYLLDLGNDRTLGIWFDGASEDRPIYWLDLTWPALTESSIPMAPVDVEIEPRHLVPLRIRIAIDPSLPSTHKVEIKNSITSYLDQHPLKKLPGNDPFFRLQLLGDQFRGRMVSNHRNKDGQPYLGDELFDGALAQRALLPQAQ